jgi:ABC-type nitrate/sulfonate/bicarbonate transport system substrate-binding protein
LFCRNIRETLASKGLMLLEWLRKPRFYTKKLYWSGYYAAKEKGYYAEQGLDVNFIEHSHEINVVDQVISGVAQYGIEDSGLNASKLSVTY